MTLMNNLESQMLKWFQCLQFRNSDFLKIAPTEKSLGRYTISPDNIAEKTLNGGPLKLITFYHDGAFVTNTPKALINRMVNIIVMFFTLI